MKQNVNTTSDIPFVGLSQEVVEDGIVIATLERLRDDLGVGRLGKHVLANISATLKGAGLVAYPEWVLDGDMNPTPRQTQEVRIIRQGTPLAELVDAVQNPSPQRDTLLRKAADGNASDSSILAQIRDLVS